MRNVQVAVNITLIVSFFFAGHQVSAEEPHLISPNIGKLVLVPDGQFQRDENSQNVSAVSSFYIAEFEVTSSQYARITSSGRTGGQAETRGSSSRPVVNITWYDAIYFSNILSMAEKLAPVYSIGGETDPDKWGEVPTSEDRRWDSVVANWEANGYRLPTEMEWRWAAMGAIIGSTRRTNETGYKFEYSSEELGNTKFDSAWCATNSQGASHTVGSKKPNRLGIYDMTGNAWEWNWDWYGQVPVGQIADYRGPRTGNQRLLHGGSWRNNEDRCNNTFRLGHPANFVYSNIGFRLVRIVN